MAMAKCRKAQLRQRELNRKLDEIAADRAKERRAANKVSYCMHTPKEALRELGERSRSRY